jgi:glyoxylate reductase
MTSSNERPGREPAAQTPAMRALLTWPCPPSILAPLAAMGVSIESLAPGAETSAGMQAAIVGKDALLCHPFVPVDAAVVEAGHERLRVISTYAVGYDNIDLGACRKYGIPVGHTPGVVVEATADIAYALILSVMREIIAGDRYVRAGKWMGGLAPLGRDLFGKTLGILGMGAIGKAVARRALASGMRIAYTNRRPAAGAPTEVEFVSFDALLERSDCLVILAPLSAQTRGIIGAAALAKLKPGAFLVNAARGPLVDSQALYDALAGGRLAGAAVDVVDPEPLPADHPLLTLPNFFVTPHIGTATVETRHAMATLSVANAVAGLRGEPLPAAVPLPESV